MSGVEALDRYFRAQASQDVRRRVASCFVLTEVGSETPLGFYTLAATSVALQDLPGRLSKRLPRYPSVPATVMGRLAVDQSVRGKGLGQMLLMDALARSLRSEIASFAVVVDAKDDGAAGFYRAHDFLQLGDHVRRMFLPMTEIANLFHD